MPQNDNNSKAVSQLTQRRNRFAILSFKNAGIEDEEEYECYATFRRLVRVRIVVLVLVI